jgi:hypothetical protein
MVDIDALRELLKQASTGPWRHMGAEIAAGPGVKLITDPDDNDRPLGFDGYNVLIYDEGGHDDVHAALICGALNALPELLTELEAARAVIGLSRQSGDCFDHADNCCRDWCDRCRDAHQVSMDLDGALAAYDACAVTEKPAESTT